MTIDRNQYIELYSMAMEEARHHERLYTQIWTAALIAISVVGTLSFIIRHYFFGAELPANFRWLMTILSIVLGYFFLWSVSRHAVEGDSCRDIANKIEGILAGKTREETIKIGDLLVVQKIKEIRGRWYKQVYSPFIRKPGLLVYLVPLGFWIYLWWCVL